MPWPLVGTGKGQPLPFLLLRWVEVGRILYSCLLKSPPPASGFAGATDGEIMVWQPGLFSLLVLMQRVASVGDDFCQLHLVSAVAFLVLFPSLPSSSSEFTGHFWVWFLKGNK